jgi:hypothetical protein
MRKKEKKGSVWEKKGSKKIRAPRHPGGPAGQFSRSKTVAPPRLCPAKMRGGSGRPPSPCPTPFAAGPRLGAGALLEPATHSLEVLERWNSRRRSQDFQGVRGRFKEGCLNRLRRCGQSNGTKEEEEEEQEQEGRRRNVKGGGVQSKSSEPGGRCAPIQETYSVLHARKRNHEVGAFLWCC